MEGILMDLKHENLNAIWINGEKKKLDETKNVYNPATGEIIGTYSNAGAAETNLAIDAAQKAFAHWAKLPPEDRNKYLNKWGELIREHREELALLMTKEQGKPLKESLGEVDGSVEILKWFMEESRRVYGEIIPPSNSNQKLMVFKQAIGVAGLITPMNFPAATVMRKLSSALAAGCTVILKPAGQTPLIALAFFELLMKTGLPKGTANIVTGNSSEIGSALMEDD